MTTAPFEISVTDAGIASRPNTGVEAKSASAYRTISEAAELLAVPQHVLRFWETKFPQIRPMKRSGGRRYYRPEDIETLRTIQHLLYEQGYTIKGVQRLLRLRRGLEVHTLDEQAFDSAEAAASLMIDIPAPEPVDAELDCVVAEVAAAASDVITQRKETAMPSADLFNAIPDHLTGKPAALMAAGLEAGRPVPVMAEQAVVETVAAAPVVEEVPVEHSYSLTAEKRVKLEALLGELKELKQLL